MPQYFLTKISLSLWIITACFAWCAWFLSGKMATENNSAEFYNPTVPRGEGDVQELLGNVEDLAMFILRVYAEFFHLYFYEQPENEDVIEEAMDNLYKAYGSIVTAYGLFDQGGPYSQFVRLRNVYNVLNEAIGPLRGMTEHVPEDYINVLLPALLAIQELPSADNTAVEAALTVEIAIPKHVQTNSPLDEDQNLNND